MMNTKVIPASDPQALLEALAVLKKGGLVAYPTDTVYGVGGLAFDPGAIEGLYQVKGRDYTKAIPILLSKPVELSRVTLDIGKAAHKLAERFWPGPLTLVVPRHPDLPENISPDATIGVRMPDHPVALGLLRISGPLATTSANLSGETSTRSASEVVEQLGGRIPLVLDGGITPGGTASTVVDCTSPEPVILREGPISLQQIKGTLA
jgi:L-threonylcarbamoyladenylate synthase